MGVVNYLYHPDTVVTASELGTLALDLLAEIPIPGVEGCCFDSEIIRQTFLQVAVDQKSIKAVTDTTRGSYSDDYTLQQLHTVPVDDLESTVNNLFAQQAAMILGPGPRIIYLDFVDSGLITLSTRRYAGSGKRRPTVSAFRQPTANWTRAETARVQRSPRE